MIDRLETVASRHRLLAVFWGVNALFVLALVLFAVR
jgi:hypothetical protein